MSKKPNYVGSYICLLDDKCQDDLLYRIYRVEALVNDMYVLSQLYTTNRIRLSVKAIDNLGYNGKLVIF